MQKVNSIKCQINIVLPLRGDTLTAFHNFTHDIIEMHYIIYSIYRTTTQKVLIRRMLSAYYRVLNTFVEPFCNRLLENYNTLIKQQKNKKNLPTLRGLYTLCTTIVIDTIMCLVYNTLGNAVRIAYLILKWQIFTMTNLGTL